MVCTILTKTSVKILGILFLYNKNLETEENFIKHVWKIEKKLWRMQNLTVEGIIATFKTLGISKIIHFSLVTSVPMEIMNEIKKIQKEWDGTGTTHKLNNSPYVTNMKIVA